MDNKKIKNVLIVGGASGIGLTIAALLSSRPECERVYIVDKNTLPQGLLPSKCIFFREDFTDSDFSIFDSIRDINCLVVTVGFGKLALFRDVSDKVIIDSFAVNAVAPIRIIHKYFDKLNGKDDFYCTVMGSISGFMSSPFFSVYGATKASLKVFVESINVELEKDGSSNKVMIVAPGSIKGTSFNGSATDVEMCKPLACEIIDRMEKKEDLFIPKYDEVFREVLERYHKDFRAEGLHSYDYKKNSGRLV